MISEQEFKLNLGRGKDIRNEKFGRLKPLYPLKERKFNTLIWHCSCECGNEVDVSLNHLRTGHTQSCRCLQKEKVSKFNTKNEIGKTFGKLLVLEEAGRRQGNYVLWKCKCNCGNTVIVSGADLRSGHTKSCGCISSNGEEKISQVLTQNNIKFEKEKTFESCRFPQSNYLAKFDFYLPDYNCLIEYDGIQHYCPQKFHNISDFQAQQNFIKTQEYDNYKNLWAIANKIKLIRIPYWDKENIDINYIFNKIRSNFMYCIIDSRSSGKTSRLMLLAKENNAAIACSNPSAMRTKAYSYGITGIDFIPYSDLFEGKYEGNVLIDELDLFVRYFIDANLIGYSLTNED